MTAAVLPGRGRPATARWPALGTHARVVVTAPDALDAAEALVRAQLGELDAAASRFRDDSELSRLVAAAPVTTTVSPVLAAALAVALRAARQTGGLVDPGLGAAMRAAGYDGTFAVVASRGDDPADLFTGTYGGAATATATPSTQDWRGVRLTGRRLDLPGGVALDLGATAKAWAADRAARSVARRLGTGCLVELGGDLAVAGDAPADGWPIAVGDDAVASGGGEGAPEGAGETVALRAGGLATSSTGRRTWHRGGTAYHHLLDPRTGGPARPVWRSVTVAAATCADANTASTAAVVLGAAAPEWLRDRRLPARLEAPDGRVLRVAGWPCPTAELEAH